MMIHHRGVILVSVAGLVGVLSGCASSHSTSYTRFANAFLPAAPAAEMADASVTVKPAVESGLYKQEPIEIPARVVAAPAKATEVDARIAEADTHFAEGKRYYEQGETEKARLEFDAALEALMNTRPEAPERQRAERKLDQLTDAIFRYDAEGLGAGRSNDQIGYDRPPMEDILDMTFPVDPNLKPKVAGELSATVSQLPLELRDPVLSFIHYFSTDRGHKTVAAGLRRAGRYRSMIESILEQEGIPKELIYLAQDESGFLPRAKSVKSCIGLWQFAQFRGREYGLTQTPYTDERMDPEKATKAAARHLHDLYKHFGDWYLAMAAYDCGPGCVDRAVERTGYADFWELQRLHALPKETMNYVPLIVAITIMAKNPKDYGLDDVQPDAPLEFETVEMAAPTSLLLAADALGTNLNELEDMNPELLKNLAPSGFTLKVPKGSAAALTAALDQVPLEHRASWRLHRMETGETLASVAKRYGSSAKLIETANAGEAAAGRLLVVPVSYRAPVVAARRPASRGKQYRRGTSATGRRRAASRAVTASAARTSKTSRSKAYTTASLHAPHRASAALSR